MALSSAGTAVQALSSFPCSQSPWLSKGAQSSSRQKGRFQPRPKARQGVQCSGKAPPTVSELIPLGKTDLRISPIGIGTLQWGDPSCGFGDRYDEKALAEVFDRCLEGGINFFDSAEVYGYQGIKSGTSSEQLLGRFRRRSSASQGPAPVVTSKFFTIPWSNLLVGGGFRLGRKSLVEALRASLKRLNMEKVDLYQIHFPFPTFSETALVEGLKEAVELGLTTAVGVSNYSPEQMEKAHKLLAESGIPLASNQVKYSLLQRKPETSSLLQLCKDLDVTLIGYQPLESGTLTESQLSREGSKTEQLRPLLLLLKSIGEAHGGKKVSQVALNYLVSKGACPIPGCKSIAQAEDHIGTLGWTLTADEVGIIGEKLVELKL